MCCCCSKYVNISAWLCLDKVKTSVWKHLREEEAVKTTIKNSVNALYPLVNAEYAGKKWQTNVILSLIFHHHVVSNPFDFLLWTSKQDVWFSKVHSNVYNQKKIIIYKNILTDWNGLLKSRWDVEVILYGDTGRWLGEENLSAQPENPVLGK